jgi:TP901 family phage tail tape measure protein
LKREIKTTLTLDGEQKFKQELQAAAREMRVLKSETRANTLAFGDHSKSVEALTQRNRDLSRQADQQREIIRALSRAVQEAAEKYGEADKRTDDYRIRLNNARAALSQIENEIRKNNKAIAEQTDWWKKAGESAEKAGKKITKAGKDMTKVGDTLTKGVTLPIVAAGTAALKASIDFETAWTGVLKTVDGTEAQLAALKQGIIDMSLELPATTTEIAAVAEAAGQLGIETDNILAFTRTMIDLGETTNIVSAEAAKQLAQFANVTQMSQRDFDRLGSVIVDLGNNFATTEADIVNMAQRLAGAGKQIGLTNPQIMAFATTLSSVGIAAEAGGSAFSKVFSNMQLAVETGSAALDDFARVAGMTADEFARQFREDAAEAIAAFITGLSNMNEEGISSIRTLQEMGITELRLRDTLLRTSNAGELVTSAINMANSAWEENTALTKEAELRYGTTASQMKILWNEAREVSRQFGDAMMPVLKDVLGEVKDLVHAFSNLDDEQKKNIIQMAALAATVGPVLSGVGRLTTGVGGLVTTFGKLSTAISKAGGIAAVMSGPAGWAVLGALALGGLALAVADGAREVRELTKDARALDSAMDDATSTFDKAKETFSKTTAEVEASVSLAQSYIERLKELEQAGLDTAESQEEYARIVEILKQLIPDVNIQLDAQTGKIIGGTQALWENTQAWKENAIAQALQAQVTEQLEAYTAAMLELTIAENKLSNQQDTLASKTQQMDKLFGQMLRKVGMTREEFEAQAKASGDAWREMDRLTVITGKLGEQYWDLDQETRNMQYSIDALNESISTHKKTVAELSEELNITEEAAKQMMDSMIKAPTKAAQAVDESVDVVKQAGSKVTKAVAKGMAEGMPEIEVTLKTVQELIDVAFRQTVSNALAQSKEMSIAIQQEFGSMADNILIGMSQARLGQTPYDGLLAPAQKAIDALDQQYQEAIAHLSADTPEGQEQIDQLKQLYEAERAAAQEHYDKLANGTAGQVDAMGEKTIQLLREQQHKALEQLVIHHRNLGTLESEEYAAELERLTTLYDSKIEVMREKYAEINDIISNALTEGREVSLEESLTIGDILNEVTGSMVNETRRREAQIAAVIASGEGPDAVKEQGEQILAILEGSHEDQLSEIRKSSQDQIQELISSYERGEIIEIEELQAKVARVREAEAEQTRLAYEEHASRMMDYKAYWDAMGLTVDEETGRIIERTDEWLLAMEEQQAAWAEEQAKRSQAQWGTIGEQAVAGLVAALEEHGHEAESAARSIGDKIGHALSQGITSGQEDGQVAVEQAAEKLAQAANNKFRDTLEIKSPSRVSYRDGAYYVDGLVKALEDGQARVARATAGLAQSVGGGTLASSAPVSNSTTTNHYTYHFVVDPSKLKTVADMERLLSTFQQVARAGG